MARFEALTEEGETLKEELYNLERVNASVCQQLLDVQEDSTRQLQNKENLLSSQVANLEKEKEAIQQLLFEESAFKQTSVASMRTMEETVKSLNHKCGALTELNQQREETLLVALHGVEEKERLIAELQERLQSSESDVLSLEMKLSSADAEVVRLEKELSDIKFRLAASELQVIELQRIITGFRINFAEMMTVKESLAVSMESAERNLSLCGEKNRDLLSEIEVLKLELKAVKKERDENQSQLLDLQMQNKAASLNATVSADRLGSLKSDHERMTNTLLEILRTLQIVVNPLEGTLGDLPKYCRRALELVESVQSLRDKLMAENKALRMEVDALVRKKEEMDGEIRQLNESALRAQEQLTIYLGSREDSESKLRHEVYELALTLAGQKCEAAQTKEALESVSCERDAAQKDCSLLLAQISALQGHVDMLEGERKKLLSETIQLQSQLRSSKTSKSFIEDNVASLEKTVKNLSNDLVNSRRDCNRCKEEAMLTLNHLQFARAEAEKLDKELSAERSLLQKSLQVLENERAETGRVMAKFQDTERRLADEMDNQRVLHEQLASKMEKGLGLENRIAELTAKVAVLTSDLERELTQKSTLRESIQSLLKENSCLKIGLDDSHSELRDLRRQLMDQQMIEAAQSDLATQLTSAEDELRSMKLQGASASRELQRLQHQLDTSAAYEKQLIEELQKNRDDLRATESLFSSAKSQALTFSQERDAVQRSVEVVRKEMESLHFGMAKLSSENERLHQEDEEASVQLTKCRLELQESQKFKSGLKDENRRLCHERDAALNTLYQRNSHLESLQASIALAQSDLARLSKEKDAAILALDQTSADLADLQQKLFNSKEKLLLELKEKHTVLAKLEALKVLFANDEEEECSDFVLHMQGLKKKQEERELERVVLLERLREYELLRMQLEESLVNRARDAEVLKNDLCSLQKKYDLLLANNLLAQSKEHSNSLKLEADMDLLHTEKENLLTALEAIRSQCDNLSSQLAEVKMERDDLVIEHEVFTMEMERDHQKVVQLFEVKVCDLKDSFIAEQVRNKSLKKTLVKKEEELMRLAKKLRLVESKASADNECLSNEIRFTKQALANLEHEGNLMRVSMEEQYNRMKYCEEREATLMNENNALNTSLLQANEQRSMNETELRSCRLEGEELKSSLQQAVVSMGQSFKQRKEVCSQLEDTIARLREAKDEILLWRERAKALEEEGADLRKTIEQLQSDYDAGQAEILSERASRFGRYEVTLAEKNERIRILGNEVVAIRRECFRYEGITRTIHGELESFRRDLDAQKILMGSLRDNFQTDFSALSAIIIRLEERNLQHEGSMTVLLTREAKGIRKLQRVLKERDVLRAEKRALQAKKDSLEAELVSFQKVAFDPAVCESVSLLTLPAPLPPVRRSRSSSFGTPPTSPTVTALRVATSLEVTASNLHERCHKAERDCVEARALFYVAQERTMTLERLGEVANNTRLKLEELLGEKFDSFTSAVEVLEQSYCENLARLTVLQSDLSHLREALRLTEVNLVAVTADAEEWRRLNDGLQMKLNQVESTLEMNMNQTAELKAQLQRAEEKAIRLSSAAEAALLAPEKALRTQAERFKSMLIKLEQSTEAAHRRLRKENMVLTLELEELKKERKVNLIRLSDIESDHSELLRKILAWGNLASPDEIIQTSASLPQSGVIDDVGDREKKELIKKLIQGNALLRWSAITLRFKNIIKEPFIVSSCWYTSWCIGFYSVSGGARGFTNRFVMEQSA